MHEHTTPPVHKKRLLFYYQLLDTTKYITLQPLLEISRYEFLRNSLEMSEGLRSWRVPCVARRA
jgi:hypothetical protein